MFNLPAHVTIVEVGPRDGLQSLDHWVDTDAKVAMIDALSDAGLPVIEVTSFAHPKVVPMLVDAEQVIARIKRRKGTVYRALVPNKRGALRAVESDIDEILGLMTVSQAYLAKNQNMTLEAAIEQGGACARVAREAGRSFIMALGMSMYCPYEGIIPVEKTLECVRQLRELGVDRFYLAASTGMEEPRQVSALFRGAIEAFPDCEFGFHVHEKMGLASANLLAALDAGATMLEGSICGIGGGIAFPGGAGSVGNVPTEDLVNFMDVMGVDTGLDATQVLRTARQIGELVNIPVVSHAGTAGLRADMERLGAQNPTAHPT